MKKKKKSAQCCMKSMYSLYQPEEFAVCSVYRGCVDYSISACTCVCVAVSVCVFNSLQIQQHGRSLHSKRHVCLHD